MHFSMVIVALPFRLVGRSMLIGKLTGANGTGRDAAGRQPDLERAGGIWRPEAGRTSS
jgi:hypothetical protein